MNVWTVRLSLSNDGRGNWLTYFRMEAEEKQYQLVNGTYRELTKSWYRDEIPSTIQVKSIASGYLAECGFNYEPTEVELETMKPSMIQAVKQFLEDEFQRQEYHFKAKMKGLIPESN